MNNIKVDGLDLYSEYGIFISEGGYNGIVQFPAMKNIYFNDWPEENGIEPDLTDPKIDNKVFGIKFCGNLDYGIENFINLLDGTGYHDFEFQELGITRRLRLVSMPSRQTAAPLRVFELQFADDDFVFDGYTYNEPVPVADCWQTGYEIDGKPLSDYGIWMTEGIEDEILTSPTVKNRLLINTDGINGAVYDGETDVVFGSRDVSLKCHIKADMATFWQNWNALFYNITRPGEHLFYFDKRLQEYPFYYKSCSVGLFTIIGGEVWCDFEITACFISLQIGSIYYLLASERGELIITEDGQFNIDVS